MYVKCIHNISENDNVFMPWHVVLMMMVIWTMTLQSTKGAFEFLSCDCRV